LLRKYLIIEDECASCTADHIDVWISSDGSHGQAVLQCEDAWTPDGLIDIEVTPARDRPVDRRPFFDMRTGVCRPPEEQLAIEDPATASYVVTRDTPYYKGSPAQGTPPDGTLTAGTRVRVLQASSSYTRVRTEDGEVTGWVSSADIAPCQG